MAGSTVLDMALDTGATYTLIPRGVAEELGCEPGLSLRKVSLMTASAVEAAPLVVMNRVHALGVSALDVDVVCHDLPSGSRVKGLLGLSFLKHFDMDLYFRSRTLEARGQ